jgi:hypothetical protein
MSALAEPTADFPPTPAAPRKPRRDTWRWIVIGLIAAVAIFICLVLLAGGTFYAVTTTQQQNQQATLTAIAGAGIATNTAEAAAIATHRAERTATATALSGQATATRAAEVTATQQAEDQRHTATAIARATGTAVAGDALAELGDALSDDDPEGILRAARGLDGVSPLFGPWGGELSHYDEDDYVVEEWAFIEVRDFVAEAVFFNPYDRSRRGWDEALFFRATPQGELRLVIASDYTYELIDTSVAEDGNLERYYVIRWGSLPLDVLDTTASGSNRITLVVRGAEAYFYLNGAYVARLDVSRRGGSGDVGVVTGAYVSHEITGESTRYEGFTVWELP